MRQDLDDYEIIVSDNHSGDATPEVVRKLGESRVRYARTTRAFSIPDSCEFALSHARGEYVTYLCDDDAIRPLLLQNLADTLRAKRQRSYRGRLGRFTTMILGIRLPTATPCIMQFRTDGH